MERPPEANWESCRGKSSLRSHGDSCLPANPACEPAVVRRDAQPIGASALWAAAVHRETAGQPMNPRATSGSILLCLRRFMARRGFPGQGKGYAPLPPIPFTFSISISVKSGRSGCLSTDYTDEEDWEERKDNPPKARRAQRWEGNMETEERRNEGEAGG